MGVRDVTHFILWRQSLTFDIIDMKLALHSNNCMLWRWNMLWWIFVIVIHSFLFPFYLTFFSHQSFSFLERALYFEFDMTYVFFFKNLFYIKAKYDFVFCNENNYWFKSGRIATVHIILWAIIKTTSMKVINVRNNYNINITFKHITT